jgi:hypothetical protein
MQWLPRANLKAWQTDLSSVFRVYSEPVLQRRRPYFVIHFPTVWAIDAPMAQFMPAAAA